MSTRAQFCSKRCRQEDQRRREQADLVAATADRTAALLANLQAGRTVVVNRSRRGPHAHLLDDLESSGRLVRIHRRQRGESGPDSKWNNPFKLAPDADDDQRAEVIERYRSWLLGQPELLASLPELRAKALGCWCWPKRCHGDVLAELANATTDVPKEN